MELLPSDGRPPDAGSPAETRELEALNEVARIATADLELRPMLQRITDTLARSFGWPFVALITIDEERSAFVCEALTTDAATDVHIGYCRPLGSGVVGEVAATERPVVIDDVAGHPNYVETMPGAQSEICVPIKHKGQLVAILNLESTHRAAFHGQLTLLMTIAEQIAGAIASARLYEELRQRARLMEMMSEVSRTALQTTDLDELLHRVVDYVHERFPLMHTAILLVDEVSNDFIVKAFRGEIDLELNSRVPIERGIVVRGLRTGKTQFVRDVTADPDYVMYDPRVIAEVVVPICFRDRVVGVFNFESTTTEIFTPANVVAFEAFADQVAGAINLAAMHHVLVDAKAAVDQKSRDLEQANEHLAKAIETLHRISTQDGLTGVANRRHFDESFALEWRRAARSHAPLSLLMIDIDFFKAFNDACGHQAGDDCLRRVAQELRHSLQRAGDVVARYGGEEFVVLLPDTDEEHARLLAEALRAKVEALGIAHPAAAGGEVVTISAGVAATTPERETSSAEALLRAADDALYAAKHAGRNRVI
jgi:diguanylate cyclase (GGDEF)-like protein